MDPRATLSREMRSTKGLVFRHAGLISEVQKELATSIQRILMLPAVQKRLEEQRDGK